jgi:hypothetical protein
VTVDALTARKTWRTAEPVHGAIYFAEEAGEVYGRLGLHGQQGYFASRAAAMGAVGPEVVIATFFNFNPDLVRQAIPSAWERATPAQVLEARLEVADRMLRRHCGDGIVGSPEVAEAAELAGTAARTAARHPEGRPLFAAHAELPWPDAPHLRLWHAQTLLREFRGDAHVALLTVEGIDGCEALVLHAATGEVPAAALLATRAWPDASWMEAEERLRARGLLAIDGTLTAEGRAHRQSVEDRTDALSVAPYAAIGEDGCDRLRALTRPLSKAIVAGGGVGFRPSAP